MSDLGGFDWWFRDRDYVLRESVESLQFEAASAHRNASRLSSRLQQVQGSLETRLDALSAAFDAYVELGDIREQLNAYSDAAAIRRDCLAAIAAAGEGRPTGPVDPRGTDYWIAWATTAVIDRAAGRPDPDLEDRLRHAVPEAELFLVAGAGLLGAGPAVADRVPALFGASGTAAVPETLHHRQLGVWHAVLGGAYDRPGETAVLRQLLDLFDPRLAAEDPQGWWRWIGRVAEDHRQQPLDWLEAVAGGQPTDQTGSAAADPPPASANPLAEGQAAARSERGQDSLRGIVLELIEAGHGPERDLLRRARELRSRIEDPEGQQQNRPDAPMRSGSATGSGSETTVLAAVREAYASGPVGSGTDRVIFARLAPLLSAAAEAGVAPTLQNAPLSEEVRLTGGVVTVGPDGPDQAHRTDLDARLAAASEQGRDALLYASAAVGAVALVAALVSAIAGVPGLAIAALLVGVIGAVVAVSRLYRGRQQRQWAADERQRADQRIAEVAERLRQRGETVRADTERRRAQLDRVQQALGAFTEPQRRPDPSPSSSRRSSPA